MVAISISYEVREREVMIALCRVIDSRIPKGLNFDVHCRLLDWILKIRGKQSIVNIMRKLSRRDKIRYVNEVLSFAVTAIQEHADSIMRGDFSVYEDEQ